MRAVVAETFGGPEVLQVAELDVPQPAPLQVRIAVDAAAVNPVDVVTRAGILHDAGLHDAGLHEGLPLRFGWDVIGRVDAVGAGVRRLRVGQSVIGLSDRLSARSKTHADCVVLDESAVAAAPPDLPVPVGAALPLAGLTAVQVLNMLGLVAGQSLLVTGAAGAVGSLAVQLARLRGLRVVAAGRSADATTALGLGADEFVDAARDMPEAVRRLVPGGVDGALDAAGLATASLDAVRTGGAHLSLNVLTRPAPLRHIRSASLAVAADWEQLTVLAMLAATGVLQVAVVEELGLGDVQKAHEMLGAGGVRGRIIVHT